MYVTPLSLRLFEYYIKMVTQLQNICSFKILVILQNNVISNNEINNSNENNFIILRLI